MPLKFFFQLCCTLALLFPAALARRCAQVTGATGDRAVACPRVWPAARKGDAANDATGPARVLRYSFDLSGALGPGTESNAAAESRAPGRVHITLDLQAPASGTEVLALPSEWAETTGLERGIENLEVSGQGARLAAGPTAALQVLHAAPSAPVRVAYDLVGNRGMLAGVAERHRVLLRPGLVEFNGSNGLVAPAMDAAARVHLTLRFSGLPESYAVVTSFGAGTAEEMTGSWREVRGALFVGGALRTQQLVVGGAPVLLAIVPPRSGEWRFTDDEAAAKVRTILAAERMFWRDLAIPWYAVVIAPLGDASEKPAAGRAAGDSVGGGGTAFTHAFLLSLAPREGFGTETESLFAHEAFHEWNPLGMGSAGATPTPAWFTEGVTTFYQDRLLERAKLLDAEEYLRRVNRIVRDDRLLRQAQVTSDAARRDGRVSQDARTAPGGRPMRVPGVTQIGQAATIAAARLDAEARTYRAPYLRGALMAMWLDAEIRQQTKGARSLDDLMLALRADRDQPLTEERVLHTAAYLVDAATIEQMRGFAEQDGEVPFYDGRLVDGLGASLGAGAGAAPGSCVEVRERALWSFDLGLDPAELRQGAVLGSVREASAAWRAGLRKGQVVEGWEMWTGDADHEVVIMVRGPAGRTSVHYLPRGEQVKVPQAEMESECSVPGKAL